MDILMPSNGKGLTVDREQHSGALANADFSDKVPLGQTLSEPNITLEASLILRFRSVQHNSKKTETSVCPAAARAK
jgi:hypothetical protein